MKVIIYLNNGEIDNMEAISTEPNEMGIAVILKAPHENGEAETMFYPWSSIKKTNFLKSKSTDSLNQEIDDQILGDGTEQHKESTMECLKKEDA